MSDKKKILCVEDDPNVLELLGYMLGNEGFEVITAEEGLQGLQMARSEKPDLIILDINLPLMDGYKVCRRLKSDKKYKKIPILMLSALDDKKNKLIGFESDVDDYETKPFETASLLRKVKKLLEPKEAI